MITYNICLYVSVMMLRCTSSLYNRCLIAIGVTVHGTAQCVLHAAALALAVHRYLVAI